MEACILGSGDHTYQWQDQWGRLPDGIAFGYTHGVAEDAQGRIFIHNMSKDAVAIFDPDGAFITSWGEEFAEGAHGMHLAREGSDEVLFLADIARKRVYKTTPDGQVLLEIGYPKESGVYEKPEDFVPTNVAVAPNGDIYVADGYASDYIHRFDRTGKYLSSFGGKNPPYSFNTLHKLAIDTRFEPNRIIAVDRANNRVVHMSLTGEFLGVVAKDLLLPAAVVISGNDAIIGELTGRVTILDKTGAVVQRVGANTEQGVGTNKIPPAQWKTGFLLSPHGVALNDHGDLFVAEFNAFGRVHRFNRP